MSTWLLCLKSLDKLSDEVEAHKLNEGYVRMSNLECPPLSGFNLSLLHAFFRKIVLLLPSAEVLLAVSDR